MASGQEELLFGRLALHYKLITTGQLEEVHGLHALAGGRRRLPEILVEMGYLSQRQVEQLLVVQHDYLEKRRAAQAAAAAAPESSATTAAAAPQPSAPAARPTRRWRWRSRAAPATSTSTAARRSACAWPAASRISIRNPWRPRWRRA